MVQLHLDLRRWPGVPGLVRRLHRCMRNLLAQGTSPIRVLEALHCIGHNLTAWRAPGAERLEMHFLYSFSFSVHTY